MCIAHYIAEVVAEEEKKGRKPRTNTPHPQSTTKQIQNEQDTWVPSLENWDGGLKIFYG